MDKTGRYEIKCIMNVKVKGVSTLYLLFLESKSAVTKELLSYLEDSKIETVKNESRYRH